MKLTRRQLNVLIENFLFEHEETEESLENLEVIIKNGTGTDSGVSVLLTKLGPKIHAYIKENGKETKLNT